MIENVSIELNKIYYLVTINTSLSYAYNTPTYYASLKDINNNYTVFYKNLKAEQKKHKLKKTDLAILPFKLVKLPDDVWVGVIMLPENLSIELTTFKWNFSELCHIIFRTKEDAIDYHNRSLTETLDGLKNYYENRYFYIDSYWHFGPQYISINHTSFNTFSRVYSNKIIINIKHKNLTRKYKNLNSADYRYKMNCYGQEYYIKRFNNIKTAEAYVKGLDPTLGVQGIFEEAINSWKSNLLKKKDRLDSKLERIIRVFNAHTIIKK